MSLKSKVGYLRTFAHIFSITVILACEQSTYKKCSVCFSNKCGSDCFVGLGLGTCWYRKIHGGYSSWSNWGSCSSTCGYGYRTRKRTCTSPTPRYDGRKCSGSSEQTDVCDHNPYCQDCDIKIGNRIYVDQYTTVSGCQAAELCFEKEETTQRKCYRKKIHGSWSDWNSWSTCTATCGYATRYRVRICNDPYPQYGGNDCIGEDKETIVCNERYCKDCDIDHGERHYLPHQPHILTYEDCSKLGYCWDKEDFPDGQDCYLKKFSGNKFIERKGKIEGSDSDIIGRSLSKLQCVMKCQINKNCNLSGFIPSKDDAETGTCVSLRSYIDNKKSNQEEVGGNIIFKRVQPIEKYQHEL